GEHRADPLPDHGADTAAHGTRPGCRVGDRRCRNGCPGRPTGRSSHLRPLRLPRRRLDRRPGPRGGAQDARGCAGLEGVVPGDGLPAWADRGRRAEKPDMDARHAAARPGRANRRHWRRRRDPRPGPVGPTGAHPTQCGGRRRRPRTRSRRAPWPDPVGGVDVMQPLAAAIKIRLRECALYIAHSRIILDHTARELRSSTQRTSVPSAHPAPCEGVSTVTRPRLLLVLIAALTLALAACGGGGGGGSAGGPTKITVRNGWTHRAGEEFN